MMDRKQEPEVSMKLWRISLFIIFALPGLAFSTWVTRTPTVRDLLAVSTAEMGWIIFGLAVGSLAGLVFASRAVARKGARFIIVICGLLFMLGLGAVGVSAYFASSTAVFLSLLFFGLGYGLAEVALNVEGAALERAANKTLMPALHAGFSAGTLAGAGIGSAAAAYEVPILLHLGSVAVILAAVMLYFYRYLPEGTGKEEQRQSSGGSIPLQERLGVWKEKRIIMIGLVVLGLAFTEGTANDWIPILMVDDYQVSAATGSLIFSLFVGAMMVGRLLGGYFLDRFGRVAVLRVTIIMAIVGVLLVILGQHYIVASVGVVCWGLGAALGFPVGMSAAGDEEQGAAARVGAIAMIGYISFLVGPPFIGLMGEHYGLQRALIAILIFLVISALLARSVNPVRKN
ncbi:MFS transporter [Paenibacillus sp. GCM10027626]|uniref:MFS transporter n=1 Tax=Paenibacillus sp. GCM10027626 TaxID=3273411 RepID=UPI00363B30A4